MRYFIKFCYHLGLGWVPYSMVFFGAPEGRIRKQNMNQYRFVTSLWAFTPFMRHNKSKGM